jgi:hypothetical protein
MKNADKIKQSMQVATILSATQVIYGRSKLKNKDEIIVSMNG